MKYSFLALFIIIFSIISCGKEKFATKRVKDDFKTKDIQELDFPGKLFSRKTEVKPMVDFLFIWDNTSSILKASLRHQEAMANTVNLISNKFDYRMVISPLLGEDNIHPFWESFIVFSGDSDYIPTTSIDLSSRYRTPGKGYLAMFNVRDGGSAEPGIKRAFDLTETGYKEGIFRREAHMIIVMISNGNDNSWEIKDSIGSWGGDERDYLDLYEKKLDLLRSTYKSNTFRFLSVVPHTVCEKSKDGSTYRLMSENLFKKQKMLGFPATTFSSPPDTMDFCNIESFNNLFSGINATINPVDIPYTYNYWPITTDKNWIYDEDSIVVTKKDNNGKPIGINPIPKIDPINNPDNGWSVVKGGYQLKNIIECPQHKQITCDMGKAILNVSGQFIELHGTAKITNPDYLDIHSSAPQEYYGYIKMNYKPWIDQNKKLTESIRAKMDSIPLPEGSFEYIGWQKDKNVRVKKDFSEDFKNPLYQTGYFLKLNPPFILNAGITIQVDYWPSGN